MESNLLSEKIIDIDTIIIGCGVTGLYYAKRDCDENNKIISKKNIILDGNDWIGGRIKMTHMKDKFFCTGAGVIRSDDNNILALLSDLKLNVKKNSSLYEVYGVNQDDYLNFRNTIIIDIQKLFLDNPQDRHLSVKEFLNLHMSTKVIDNIKKCCEYNDVENMMIKDLIEYYPLTDLLPNPKRDMYHIDGGWNKLLEALMDKIKHKYEIHLESLVVEIIKSESHYVVKYKHKSDIYVLKCNKLIVATDLKIKNTVKFTNFDSKLIEMFLDQFEGIKFAKLFTYHEFLPSHFNNIKLNHSVLSKMIRIDDNLLMAGYAQNENAEYLHEILDSTFLNKQQKLEIINVLIKNTGIKNISSAIDFKFQYWINGIHCWKTKKISVYQVYNQTGLVFLGELVGKKQGWVEGAVETVNRWYMYLKYIHTKEQFKILKEMNMKI